MQTVIVLVHVAWTLSTWANALLHDGSCCLHLFRYSLQGTLSCLAGTIGRILSIHIGLQF